MIENDAKRNYMILLRKGKIKAFSCPIEVEIHNAFELYFVGRISCDEACSKIVNLLRDRPDIRVRLDEIIQRHKLLMMLRYETKCSELNRLHTGIIELINIGG